MAKIRNTKGQLIREKNIAVDINKKLQNIASEYEIRLGALVRDELEDTIIHELYKSYTPTISGSYNHTHTLVTGTYAVIENNTVRVKVSDRKKYKVVDKKGNIIEKPAQEVYNILKHGTTDHPKSDVYPYVDKNDGIKFAKYEPIPPHNFETETMKHMRVFINNIKQNPEIALSPSTRGMYKIKRKKH